MTTEQTELTKEWVTAETKRFIESRGWTRSDVVKPHDLWMNNQHEVPGGPQDERAARARIRDVMITMVGRGPTDLFDPGSLYLYWPCPECYETVLVFRRWPTALEPGEIVECSECDHIVCDEDDDPPEITLDMLGCEFHLLPDAPIYEVDPERYHREGREAHAAGKTGNDSPYVRDSVPAQQWYAGFREAAQESRNAKQLQTVLDHPVTQHASNTLSEIERLLELAVTNGGVHDERVREALRLTRWPEELPRPERAAASS